MAHFVVTGANKGIGLAVVKRLLDANNKAFVFLGSRDSTRGQEAVQSILESNQDLYSGRVETLQIDVSDDSSVSQAAETVRARLLKEDGGDGGSGTAPARSLKALINNAGMMPSDDNYADEFESCMNINFSGPVRVTEAFLPLLDPSEGRVVFTSSSLAATFVGECSPERRALMTDSDVTHPQITGFLDECLAIASAADGKLAEKFAAAGLAGVGKDGKMGVYGLSKALVNMYNLQLAREHPALKVNACTPGFIKSDMTIPHEKILGKSLDELGAKTPSEGARVIVFLATGDVPGSGWFFGSDSQRSPLDRYRRPGDAAYDGQ